MELRVLKYFLMVAREESITRAAERLHITQPTLSRQIAGLESEMGVSLIERGGRNISLTPEGILLRRRAEEIINLVDKTEMEVTQPGDILEGTINVAGGDLAAARDFVRLIKDFQYQHPAVCPLSADEGAGVVFPCARQQHGQISSQLRSGRGRIGTAYQSSHWYLSRAGRSGDLAFLSA